VPDPEAEVGCKVLQHVCSPGSAQFSVVVRPELARHGVEIAEGVERGTSCVARGVSLIEKELHAHVEVILELVVDVGVDVVSPESQISTPAVRQAPAPIAARG
jgi:hypothetical protein